MWGGEEEEREEAYIAGVFLNLNSSSDVHTCQGDLVLEVIIRVAVNVIELYSFRINSAPYLQGHRRDLLLSTNALLAFTPSSNFLRYSA
jgi:hypothetical protein